MIREDQLDVSNLELKYVKAFVMGFVEVSPKGKIITGPDKEKKALVKEAINEYASRYNSMYRYDTRIC